MARPIKETPTLYGEDARRFAEAIENPRPMSTAEFDAIMASHQRMISIANFAL